MQVSTAALLACGLSALVGGRVHAQQLGADSSTAFEVHLFLIGDAGSPRNSDNRRTEPILHALDSLAVLRGGSPTTVVFLGDNIYEFGALPGPRSTRILAWQLDSLPKEVPRWVIPGNHDWADIAVPLPGGYVRMRREWQLVNDWNTANRPSAETELAAVIPRKSCPGPESRLIGGRVDVIALDSEWWLQHGNAPVRAAAGCAIHDSAGVADELRHELKRAADSGWIAIVASHHPLVTGGRHGVCQSPCGASAPAQNVDGQRYARFIRTLLDASNANPPLIFAAGHDHNLQILTLNDGKSFQVVSGAGAPEKPLRSGEAIDEVRCLPNTVFRDAAPGFMEVVVKGREVRIRAFAVVGSPMAFTTSEIFSAALTGSPPSANSCDPATGAPR